MFIRDPYFSHPGSRVRIQDSGSRIRIKEFKYFYPKHCFLALENMIRVVHPGSGSWFCTHPGSWIQGPKRHRIRIRNTDSSGADSGPLNPNSNTGFLVTQIQRRKKLCYNFYVPVPYYCDASIKELHQSRQHPSFQNTVISTFFLFLCQLCLYGSESGAPKSAESEPDTLKSRSDTFSNKNPETSPIKEPVLSRLCERAEPAFLLLVLPVPAVVPRPLQAAPLLLPHRPHPRHPHQVPPQAGERASCFCAFCLQCITFPRLLLFHLLIVTNINTPWSN